MLNNFREKFARLISPMAYHRRTVGGTNNGSNGAKFNNGLSQSSPHTLYDHWSSRQQARAKLKDSPIAKGVLERFKENVIGKGLRLDPQPIGKILGMDDEQMEEWAEDVGSKFHIFCNSNESTTSEVDNFYQLQALAHFSRHRDGEYFPKFNYSNKKDRQSPLSIGLIDPTQIRGDAFTSSLGPLGQDDGIIRDAAGRETGYKVWIQDKNAPFKMKNVVVPARFPKSGRISMGHSFTSEYAGQGRGFTRLFHVIQELENIVDFQLSTLKQAINQSNIFASIKPSQDAPATNPIANISGGIGAVDDIVTGEVVENVALEYNYHQLDEATLNTPGSLLVANMGPGEELEYHSATVKGESYAQYTDAIVDLLAPSLGMPSEVLKMKFGNNFSASRATLILYWNIVEILREEEATDLLNPFYKAWLSEEIASGRIQAPGWSDPVKRAAWLNCAWIGSPMPNIDPVKTALANKHNMEMDLTNPDRAAKELNGTDAKKNKIKNERHFAGSELKPWQSNFGIDLDEEEE
jgi:capsid protein